MQTISLTIGLRHCVHPEVGACELSFEGQGHKGKQRQLTSRSGTYIGYLPMLLYGEAVYSLNDLFHLVVGSGYLVAGFINIVLVVEERSVDCPVIVQPVRINNGENICELLWVLLHRFRYCINHRF